MLRGLVVLLLLANLAFFGWTEGWLEPLGLPAHPEREPQRLARQVRPETITVLAPGSAAPVAPAMPTKPAAPASAPAADATPAAAATSGALTQCLEAGPFEPAAAASAVAALQDLPPDSWADLRSDKPGLWLVYMGPFANREALTRKADELRRTRLAFDEVKTPRALENGLSLGRYTSPEAADAALQEMAQRGIRTARVVEAAAPQEAHRLRAERADPALAERLAALGSTLGKPFVACTDAQANSGRP